MLWPESYLQSTVGTLKVFPGDSDSKESACNAEDPDLIPGSGRSLGKGNGNPLQYSCLENFKDRGLWQATVHRVTRVRQDWLPNTFTFSLSKCTIQVMQLNHPQTTPPSQSVEKLSSMKSIPSAKKVGDHWKSLLYFTGSKLSLWKLKQCAQGHIVTQQRQSAPVLH